MKYDEKGLITAVVQDVYTGEVLMVAYMNEESLELTKKTGETVFFSRSRNELWHKGETSGNVQKVMEISKDCDEDCLLIKVEQTGGACHTGNRTCFYRNIDDEEPKYKQGILTDIFNVVKDRSENPQEGSYTNFLLEKGIDKILKKLGEECTETVIAAKNGDKAEIALETADLLYHLTVMLYERGLTFDDVYKELQHRR